MFPLVILVTMAFCSGACLSPSKVGTTFKLEESHLPAASITRSHILPEIEEIYSVNILSEVSAIIIKINKCNI